MFGYLTGFGPRDPYRRVPRAMLRRLVVRELRVMISKRFYDKLRKTWYMEHSGSLTGWLRRISHHRVGGGEGKMIPI